MEETKYLNHTVQSREWVVGREEVIVTRTMASRSISPLQVLLRRWITSSKWAKDLSVVLVVGPVDGGGLVRCTLICLRMRRARIHELRSEGRIWKVGGGIFFKNPDFKNLPP